MGGVNIYCGSFVGNDKSGTKFETVLNEVVAQDGSDKTRQIVLVVMESINDAEDHILISAEDAEQLIVPLTEYVQRLPGDISTFDMREYCVERILRN